jgi:P4 family phage/plasmid primase-like protien
MSNILKKYVVPRGTKEYTHQDLKGGLFNIPKDKYDDLYTHLLKIKKSSLCEKLTDVFKLYFDIDKYTLNIPIRETVRILAEQLTRTLVKNQEEMKEDEPELDFTYHILKNKSKENYHVYFPNILVNKSLCRKLIKYLNQNNENKVLDDNAYNSCFRMYHVLKFERKKNKYLANSNYDFLDSISLNDLEKFQLLCIQTDKNELNVKFESSIENKIKEQEEKIKKKKKKLQKINSGDIVDLDELEGANNFIDFKRDGWIKRNVVMIKDYEYIKYLLMDVIKKERCDDYGEWSKIIMILASLKIPKRIMIKWSKLSSKYDEGTISFINDLMKKSKQNNFNYYDQYKALLNIAKQDDFVKFNEYIIGLSKYEYKVLNFNQIKFHLNNDERGICEMFYKLFHQRIISFGPEDNLEVYFWNGDIWQKDENQMCQYLFQHYVSQNLDYFNKQLQYKIKQLDPSDPEVDKYYELLKNSSNMRKQCNRSKYSKQCFRNTLGANLLNNPDFKDMIDGNPDAIAVRNGNIDLKTGKLVIRRYDDYNTFFLDIEFEEFMKTPNMDKFMDEIMLSQKEIIEFLSTFIGYSITGHNKEQMFSVWYGDKGSNGKSVLAKLLDKTFGEYFTILDSEIFSKKKGTAGTATTHLNYIQDKRFGIMDESNKNEEMNEGLVKRITGGTKLRIRKLHKESELIEVVLVPIILTNFKPKFSNDPALFRRMILIEFEAQFLDDETDIKYDINNPRHKWKDSDIDNKISENEVLSYFIRFATKWYQSGQKLKIPDKIKKYNKKFQHNCNVINKFLDNECELTTEENQKYFTNCSQLYSTFQEYCKNNNENCMAKNEFEGILLEKNIRNIKNDYDELGFNVKLINEF